MRCFEAERNKNDCEQGRIEQRVVAAEARYAGGRQNTVAPVSKTGFSARLEHIPLTFTRTPHA
jgi:hypothetical protein